MALTPKAYQQVKTTVLQALERPATERAAWLAEACGDDTEIRQEAERLLKLHDEAPDSFLDGPLLPGVAGLVRDAASDAEGATDDRQPRPLPDRIGPYRPLQVLGEGGMGVVYEAEQTEPVQRRVALKVIKAGMDSSQVLARFDAERQALAVMDHPSIARVLDVGQTEDGSPFFAMELVRGLPITDYCDRARLTTRERVELLRPVCQAIQHAHQKGVVHRDLKPSNILVMEQDGKPTPKVIDFGIAKALGRSLTEKTLVTELGQAIGTPAYMSPEQAEASTLDIDTRTDVYSLGVLLHELLTGRLPHETESSAARYLSKLAAGQVEPPSPSSQVSTLEGEKAAAVAHSHRSSVEALSRELRGDLDWITLRAMNPDRARRYETVNGLDADLQRYLANEPVTARPPTLGYRVRKFVRRNRAGVAAAGAVAALLVIFSGVLSVQSVRLAQERDVARAAEAEAARERDAARAAGAEAEQQAETAKQVSDFLVDLFSVSDPSESRGETITAQEVLDRGVEMLSKEGGLEEQPVVRARLLMTLGKVHRSLGSYAQAGDLLQDSLETWPIETPAHRAERAECMAALAGLLSDTGDFQAARLKYEQALAATEELGDPAGNLGGMLNNFGRLLRVIGDYEGARDALERSQLVAERTFGPEHENTAATHASLGELLFSLGDYEGARSRFERAVTIFERVHDREHPAVASMLGNLSVVYRKLGDHGAALEAAERSLRSLEKTLGPEHPNVAAMVGNLAAIHREKGDIEAALPLFERALSIQVAALGGDHLHVGESIASLASLRYRVGELDAARELFERALTIREKALGPEHDTVASTLAWLGVIDHDGGDHRSALLKFERALAIGEAVLDPAHPRVSTWRRNLAGCLFDTGDHEAALRLRERALKIAEEANAENPKDLFIALEVLAMSHREAGEIERAKELLARAVAVCEEKLGADHPTTQAFRDDVAALESDARD